MGILQNTATGVLVIVIIFLLFVVFILPIIIVPLIIIGAIIIIYKFYAASQKGKVNISHEHIHNYVNRPDNENKSSNIRRSYKPITYQNNTFRKIKNNLRKKKVEKIRINPEKSSSKYKMLNKFCPECGLKIKKKTKFCPGCGKMQNNQ